MTCDKWTGGDVCGAPAIWAVICEVGGDRFACAACVVQMVRDHLGCQVEVVSCG